MFNLVRAEEQYAASINPQESEVSLFSKHWKYIPVVTLAVLLSGCLSDDDTPAAPTLGGTAATGAPIVGGTVNVKCAGGGTLSDVTDSAGIWQVTLSGQTLPCAIEVSGGNLAGGQTYYSVALQPGTVNVTPLTDLIVANLAGQAPSVWFGGLNANAFQQLTSGAVNAALVNLRTALGLAALDDIDPLTASFVAVPGDPLDNVLEAMQIAFADYAALVDAAFGDGFASFAEQYRAALEEAYADLPIGGGGGSGSCSGSEESLTYASSSAGGPHSDGQKICFTASTTSLAFSGKTLTNPTPNLAVQAPYSAYVFVDAGARYEVIFNGGDLHEINVLSADGNSFYGQFAAASTPGGGSSNLTIRVTAGGVASPDIVVGSVPAPANEFQFCNDLWSDPNFTGLGSAGTLTINSCSFANNVGTISATVALTSPVIINVPYTVTYTYN
jgi:ABC-type amino acid transport substrate-binding protein